MSSFIGVDWYKWNFKEPNSNVCFHHSFVYSAHISWDKWSPKQWTEYWKVIISDKNDDSQMMGKTSEMRFRFETFRFTRSIPSLLCCFSESLERSWNIYHIRYMDIICCHWNQWKDTRWLDKQSVTTSKLLFDVQPISNSGEQNTFKNM